MPTSVTMPALGESVTEGTVTQWLKKEGDTVEVDEPLLEVSTDKVDTEVPSPVAGVLLKIVAPEDTEVEIGGELAIIGDPSESAGSAPAEPAPEQEPLPEPEAAPAEAPAAEAARPLPRPRPRQLRPPAAPRGPRSCSPSWANRSPRARSRLG